MTTEQFVTLRPPGIAQLLGLAAATLHFATPLREYPLFRSTPLAAIIAPDANGNAVARGEILNIESNGNIVYSDKQVVALIGVENLVIALKQLGNRSFVRPHFQAADTDRAVSDR